MKMNEQERSNTPEMHPFTLRYRGKAAVHETRFREETERDNNIRLRLVAGLGAVLYLLFGFADLTYPGQYVGLMHLLRYAVTIPLLVLFFGLTYLRAYPKIAPALNFGLIFIIAVSVIAMQVVVKASDPFVFISILLLQMAMVLILRPRFLNSLLINVSILLFYTGVDLYFDVHSGVAVLRVLIYLSVGAVIASVSSYAMERDNRVQYFLAKLLEEQRQRALEAEKLEAVREMARAVAHEFNTPLGSILGAYQYAVQPRMDEHKEQERDLLQQIPRNVQRMESLVNRLLEVTRLEKREYVQGIRMMDLAASTEPNGD